MKLVLPRYVEARHLANGLTAYYFRVPTYYRRLGCRIANEPLGTNYVEACGVDGQGGPRTKALNALLDEWLAKRAGEPVESLAKYGTIDWLFREYKQSEAYLERVSERTRPDYERTMKLLTNIVTNKGDRVGDRKINAITPMSADKLYNLIIKGPRGPRLRQGEKAIVLYRRAWRVIHRLYPELFDSKVPNPWAGVTKKRRAMATKPAATREEVYAFAWGAIESGYPEPAAAAVICFEWLQRPENVLAGYVRWTDYRGTSAPNAIKIEHHKTGAKVLHPLQDRDGTLFYPEAEDVLGKLPRRGVPLILKLKVDGTSEPYTVIQMAKRVRKLRDRLGLASTFTLDACRHGGMTELEEAELTDGQGRALSAHKSKAYEGYAKRTEMRALAATRKRHAHRLANNGRTEFPNERQNSLPNEVSDDVSAIAESVETA